MSVSKQNSDESSVEENGEAITEDDERLKGDAIGDTLYSESWILKTLMKLTEELPSYSKNHNNFETQESNAVELDESLETDLCLLWDMSADKEVAHCLFQHDILSLAKCVIEESVAPRLTEIGIGILANLACQQKIGHEILLDSELLTGVVNLMSSEDSQTIIQIVRLLDNLIHYSDNKSYHYSDNKSCSSLLDDEALWMSVAFILENSLKEELLIGSAKLLENLTRHMKHDEEVPYKKILSGIIEAQKQLQSGNSDIAFDYPLEVRDSFVALVSAFYNFSRHKPMQIEIVNARDRVDSFLSFHFSFLLKSVCDSTEEELASLTASAVQAVTIFFITFSSAPLDCKILELVGHVGSKLEPYVDGENELSKCASDFSEIVGDCFRKQLDLFAIDYFLGLLESLNTKALAFILQAAHRTVPDRLQQLVDAARSRGSFNKVIETYESCVRNAVR